jgi:hypothetical protein
MKFYLKDEYVEKIGQNPVLLSFIALRTGYPANQIKQQAIAIEQDYLTRLDMLHALQSFYGLHSIYHLLETHID